MKRLYVIFFIFGLHLTSSCQPPQPKEGEVVNSPCLAKQYAETANTYAGIVDPTYGGDELAQSFKVLEEKKFNSVRLKLIRKGEIKGVTHSVQVSVVADEEGKPSNDVPLAAGILLVANISDQAAGMYQVILTPTITLKPDKVYWLRVKGSYGSSTKNNISWVMTNDGIDNYTDGQALYETADENIWNHTSFPSGVLTDFVFSVGEDC